MVSELKCFKFHSQCPSREFRDQLQFPITTFLENKLLFRDTWIMITFLFEWRMCSKLYYWFDSDSYHSVLLGLLKEASLPSLEA